MWDRRNLPLLVAVCLSVLLHVLTIGGAYKTKVGPHDLAIDLGHHPGGERPRREESFTLSLAEPAPEPPKSEPTKPKAPEKSKSEQSPKPEQPAKPKPPDPQRPKVEKYPDQMGEKTGTGKGSNKATGDESLQAREADEDQAFLSRDPVGPGRVGGPPSESLLPPGDNGHGGSPGAATPHSEAIPSPPVPPVSSVAAGAPGKADPAQRPTETAAKPPAPQPRRIALALPHPAAPEPKPDLSLGPVVLAPRPAAAPPIVGDRATVGEGDSGVHNDQLPPADKSAVDAVLPRPATRPSQTPGHVDGSNGTSGPLEVAVPRVAPAPINNTPDAPPKPAHPAFALFTAPAAPPPTPAPSDPTISQPRDPQVPKPDAKPAPRRETARSATPAAPATPPTPAIPAIARGTGDGRRPGPARPAADPAQMSDSESDAFSKTGSVSFRDGRLDVQFGRKVKTVRPHIPIVGQIDSLTLRNPSVTLKVSIDETGKVTQVAVHKSSGSNEIDTPCLEAVYDWWFEPLTNAKGKPIPDVVLFTINFR